MNDETQMPSDIQPTQHIEQAPAPQLMDHTANVSNSNIRNEAAYFQNLLRGSVSGMSAKLAMWQNESHSPTPNPVADDKKKVKKLGM